MKYLHLTWYVIRNIHDLFFVAKKTLHQNHEEFVGL